MRLYKKAKKEHINLCTGNILTFYFQNSSFHIAINLKANQECKAVLETQKSRNQVRHHNLTLNLNLHPGFELHSEVIIMDGDTLNQPSDQCFIIFDNLGFLLIKKGFKV